VSLCTSAKCLPHFIKKFVCVCASLNQQNCLNFISITVCIRLFVSNCLSPSQFQQMCVFFCISANVCDFLKNNKCVCPSVHKQRCVSKCISATWCVLPSICNCACHSLYQQMCVYNLYQKLFVSFCT